MSEREYSIGDPVEVDMPDGWRTGRVMEILPNFAWFKETWYSVQGKMFLVTTSARSMRTTSA